MIQLEEKTKPKPRFEKENPLKPEDLAAQRYGTREMVDIWGAEKTFEYSLRVQGISAKILSEMNPELVPPEQAEEIMEKASLKYVNPDRIRKLEQETGHDIIALNTALEEVLSKEAATHVHKLKTSADVTQPAKALQLKDSLEVIIDSVENLRDITIEKSIEWMGIPHMDTSHLYDALPGVVGKPFAHYAEMLQSDLKVLKFTYDNSIIGKWADATGNHHSAKALGVDGVELQKKYCEALGIGYMDAPAQIPGLEFEADIMYALARVGETMNNMAKYVAWGRSDDVNILINENPKKKKGSSAMPHKDSKNGNPTAEEQIMSIRNYLVGNVTTALMNCEFPYARNLAASSNSRINYEDGFKYLDHGIRRLSNVLFHLGVREERAKERVDRSFGVVTSQQVMSYLTDHQKVENPMSRSKAHDLVAEIATEAWETETEFYCALIEEEEITSRIDDNTLIKITNAREYIGDSKREVARVADKYYQKKTLE